MARRNPADGAALDPALTQKKRARRRLVGAVVLGIAAAIVLPLVLDSEPRQTITDVEIEIPPREAALPAIDPPLQPEVAAAPAAAAPAEEPLVPPSPSEPVASSGADAKAGAKGDTTPNGDAKAESRVAAGAETPRDAKAEAKTQAGAETPKVATAKARADASSSAHDSSSAAKSPSSPARPDAAAVVAGTRFALQIGAFANAGSARAQLDKARRTGLRVYTETVKTAQGERTRVRVGPFATRDEAEKARATLKLSGIDSAVVDAGVPSRTAR